MSYTDVPERGGILIEEARVASHEFHPGAQHVLVLETPAIAAAARPGSFVHVDCGPENLLRRPMSVMGARDGAIELLFKEVGHGTVDLAQMQPGDGVNLIGPIGNAFAPLADRPIRFLVGGGVGIPPILFFAEALAAGGDRSSYVIAGSELPFPFVTAAATLELPGLPLAGARSLARLQERGIANRLASRAHLPGAVPGLVTDVVQRMIGALGPRELRRAALYACGPTAMLAACAALARREGLPCQVCLEEFMACGVGGCAGCTVEIVTSDGPAMKRVCVDGPVFDASAVFPVQPLPEPEETVFE